MNIMFNNLNKKDVEILQWTDIWKKILETLSMQPYISFICLKSFYMYVYARYDRLKRDLSTEPFVNTSIVPYAWW